MTRHRTRAILTLVATLAACDGTSTDSPLAPQAVVTQQGPVIVPVVYNWYFPDGCTGEPAVYTLTGTALIQQQGDMTLVNTHGKVEVSSGFSGVFSWTELVKTDRVTKLRYHDIEVSSATGQAFVWSVGFYHYTTANGELKVALEFYGGIGCRGR